jgi:SlyX protein
MTEERLIEIEIKLSRQEDMVDALSQTVYRQQKKIDELESLCAALARRLKDWQGMATDSPINEKPPHY